MQELKIDHVQKFGESTKTSRSAEGANSPNGGDFAARVDPTDHAGFAFVATDPVVLRTKEQIRFAARVKLDRIPKGDTGILCIQAGTFGADGEKLTQAFELAIQGERLVLRHCEYVTVEPAEEHACSLGGDLSILESEFGLEVTLSKQSLVYYLHVGLIGTGQKGYMTQRSWPALNAASYNGAAFRFGAGLWLDNVDSGLPGWADDSLEPITITFTEIQAHQGSEFEISALELPLQQATQERKQRKTRSQSASQSIPSTSSDAASDAVDSAQ